MMMLKLMGLLAIIPTTMLLVISFFVLFALRKVEAQPLKVFGYVIAALLWVGALMIFSMGIYTLSTGRCPMTQMMKGMQCNMQGPMAGHMPGMMQKGAMEAK